MDKINIKNNDGKLVVSSRQVAEDFGKRHTEVLRAIEDKLEVNGILRSPKYFIESSYTDRSNRKSKEYLLTKDGFSLLVMGFTGAKALEWKLKYIEAFNSMENQLNQPEKILSTMEMIELQFKVMKEQNQKITNVENKIYRLQEDMPLFQIDCKEIQAAVKRKGVETLGGYNSIAYNDNSLRGRVYKDIQQQLKREFGVVRYEAIKRSQLQYAKEIILEYRLPLAIEEEIYIANNQVELAL